MYFRGTNHTSVRPTTLRLNPAYELYYKELFRGISQAFAPFLLMSFLNGRIIFKMTEYKKITSTRVISLRYFQPTFTFWNMLTSYFFPINKWTFKFFRRFQVHKNEKQNWLASWLQLYSVFCSAISERLYLVFMIWEIQQR